MQAPHTAGFSPSVGVPWGEDFCPIFARSVIGKPFFGVRGPEDGRATPSGLVRALVPWGPRGGLLRWRAGRGQSAPRFILRSGCVCGDGEHACFAFGGGAGEQDLGGVDVALGDLGLGVAGFELDVGHGVSGGCFVGEGGVAQVVEGAERFGDPVPLRESWQGRKVGLSMKGATNGTRLSRSS